MTYTIKKSHESQVYNTLCKYIFFWTTRIHFLSCLDLVVKTNRYRFSHFICLCCTSFFFKSNFIFRPFEIRLKQKLNAENIVWSTKFMLVVVAYQNKKNIRLNGWTLSIWPSLFRDTDWDVDIDRSKNRI